MLRLCYLVSWQLEVHFKIIHNKSRVCEKIGPRGGHKVKTGSDWIVKMFIFPYHDIAIWDWDGKLKLNAKTSQFQFFLH